MSAERLVLSVFYLFYCLLQQHVCGRTKINIDKKQIKHQTMVRLDFKPCVWSAIKNLDSKNVSSNNNRPDLKPISSTAHVCAMCRRAQRETFRQLS